MIVRYESDGVVLFAQDDHGQVSGQMAVHWGNGEFLPVEKAYRASVETAAAMHDCGWREADEVLKVGDDGRLHDFTTYPLADRLKLYRQGVDAVEGKDAYAAVLCSLHYSGFVQGMGGLTGDAEHMVNRYLTAESERRHRLAAQLADSSTPVHIASDGRLDERTMHHFHLLRLWDLLSLLLCMTRPGSSPETRGAWFGQGEIWMPAAPGKMRPVAVRWAGEDRLVFAPFPFVKPFDVSIPYRRVPAAERALLQEKRRLDQWPPHTLHVRLDAA